MIFYARRGVDVSFDATDPVVVRIQMKQWRLTPSGGTAILAGSELETLNYYGLQSIVGHVWIGKTRHDIFVEY